MEAIEPSQCISLVSQERSFDFIVKQKADLVSLYLVIQHAISRTHIFSERHVLFSRKIILLKAYKLKLSHIASMEGLKFDELFVKLFYMRACALPERGKKACEWKSICMDKLGELLR